MSAYEPNSRHLREVLISCFNIKKSAAEAHRCSQIPMVRPLLVKERAKSGFNASRTVILTSKTGMAVEERRIVRIIGSDATSHFKAPESHGNDSVTRKLGAVRVEAERC